MTRDDRVGQRLTIAFDFAVGKTWIPWLAGATVVPKPGGGHLLAAFLREQNVTAPCCGPTLLATPAGGQAQPGPGLTVS